MPDLSLDQATDVLYARIPDAGIARSREAPSDGFVILNEDESGAVVGVQILYASEFAEHWGEHPDRHLLPVELIEALDRWVEDWKLRR